MVIGSTGNAQEKAGKFSVYSVNFVPGWYWPGMDYWNDIYLPSVGVSDQFEGNFSFGGNITFSLPEGFRARAGVSYWSDKTKGDGSSAINSLKISFTRFRLAAVYVPEVVLFKNYQTYLGIEGQFYVINNKLKEDLETADQEGQDYSFGPLVGIERSFGHFAVGAEFMYNLGSYKQDLSDGIGVIEKNVSITGPEISVSLGYKF